MTGKFCSTFKLSCNNYIIIIINCNCSSVFTIKARNSKCPLILTICIILCSKTIYRSYCRINCMNIRTRIKIYTTSKLPGYINTAIIIYCNTIYKIIIIKRTYIAKTMCPNKLAILIKLYQKHIVTSIARNIGNIHHIRVAINCSSIISNSKNIIIFIHCDLVNTIIICATKI